MSHKEKAAAAKMLFERIKKLGADEEAPAEEKAKIPEMLEEAKGLQAEAMQLKDIAELGAQIAANEEAERQNAEVEQKKKTAAGPDEWKDWGEFLHEVWVAGNPNVRRPEDRRLRRFVEKGEAKDLAEGVGATGGFLVPPEYDMTLRSVLGETSIVRSRATIIRMARRQINIPVLDQTGTTAGVPHWFGGMTFYWAEEAEEKTETDPAFRQIQLVAHKLIGLSDSPYVA